MSSHQGREGNAREILIGYYETQADCVLLDNGVIVSADNEPAANTENNADEASIVVECPGLNSEAQVEPIAQRPMPSTPVTRPASTSTCGMPAPATPST